jgi:hypothetical protein
MKDEVKMPTVDPAQAAICRKFGADPMVPGPDDKVGIARNVRDGIQPLNGMRHLPERGTCGWYLWAGEDLSQDDDFFVPLHVMHVGEWTPEVIPYLALPPGWRFLIAPGYEDVWFDEALLDPV